LFFANRGEFRSGDYEEIMNKASCLSLLSNAVLVWNTMAIMKIITELRAAGETILDEDLTPISPLMHQDVIPNGAYYFAGTKQGTTLRTTRYRTVFSQMLPLPLYHVAGLFRQ
jgi:hypothetical protein